MTAQTNQPAKFLVPFAQNDSSRVELPVTTSDATRASQSLGFPPATMQPPEAGGVPPQGEDFNGALNQVARIAWWMMLGGGFAFDNAFATATQIGGYPKGAVLQSADFLGNWISAADNNAVNPDTSTDPAGGGYVPGYQYGVTALSGLTGGTVTLTNAQAAKNVITVAGALTGALTLVVPTWLKGWTVTNNTTGAFATVIKTAAGTGITIPQNGAPTDVTGDGTNIVQPARNISAAVQPTQAMQLQQQGNSNGFTTYTGNQTLTAAQAGGVFRFLLSATGTATLPAASSLPNGSTYTLHNSSGSTALLLVTSASTIAPIAGPQQNPGVSLTFTSDSATNTWYATCGASNAVLNTTSPWFVDPSGFTIQAGASVMSGTSVAVTFPKPFAHGCLGVIIQRTGATNPTDANNTSADVVTTAGFTARSSLGNITFYWIAIGW